MITKREGPKGEVDDRIPGVSSTWGQMSGAYLYDF